MEFLASNQRSKEEEDSLLPLLVGAATTFPHVHCDEFDDKERLKEREYRIKQLQHFSSHLIISLSFSLVPSIDLFFE